MNGRRVKYLCTDKNPNFNVFKDSNMLRPNFYLFFLLIIQYLKDEKGKSCPKSAASLPVNASIMSCALASLTADAASILRVCAAPVGLFWTSGCSRTHTCWCWLGGVTSSRGWWCHKAPDQPWWYPDLPHLNGIIWLFRPSRQPITSCQFRTTLEAGGEECTSAQIQSALCVKALITKLTSYN